MGHVIRFFESIPWWTLRPDIRHDSVVAGYGEWARNNCVTAAVSDDRKLMVAYLPELRSVSVDFGFLNGDSFTVSFSDPRTGKTLKTKTQKEKKVRRIPSPPGEDLVLMIQGSAFVPYLEEGAVSDRASWNQLTRTFGGGFFRFAIWSN